MNRIPTARAVFEGFLQGTDHRPDEPRLAPQQKRTSKELQAERTTEAARLRVESEREERALKTRRLAEVRRRKESEAGPR
ncbi:hypothetical protein ORIO_19225 [Cereibacter azotoformans]|uniref:Uncharacterized protein n=1 Tax=Cereibacter azotoformans TaxID=43057 RepID=A0A2T5K5S5_9RHOB|nr:hypothetical protein [Cereibacter azotoformans]AXQ95596.1 hypothetical protein D0Z66_17680 [Cereibacter sphaeroides]PTR17787.1 hypothetical protein C8J28_11174 [Cereibacter azotoformans]UIJ32154.1 hypothetical protein LV780_17585 [Cereibacter azotoformans]ULB11955.1 hypothetical protein ORIO_19225 [Cereibacter azotoformans]